MSIKKVQAENTEDFVVKAEANGFSYTLDYASRNPNKKSMGTSPTGLLLNSLAGCQLITARSFFIRQNINVNTLKVDITEIGRASCRERGKIKRVAEVVKK